MFQIKIFFFSQTYDEKEFSTESRKFVSHIYIHVFEPMRIRDKTTEADKDLPGNYVCFDYEKFNFFS